MDGNAGCRRWASGRRKAARVLPAVTSPAVTPIAVAARAAAVTELAAASAFRRAIAAARRAMTPVRGAAARRGSPAALRAVVSRPPPGPLSNPGIWRSPLRGQWPTSLLGLVPLCGLPIVAVTGLLSYAAYNPRLPGNDETPGAPLLKFFLFSWPTQPFWLYRVDPADRGYPARTIIPDVPGVHNTKWVDKITFMGPA